MFFGNAHVHDAVRQFLRDDIHTAARRHGSRDAHDAFVLLCQFKQGIAEHTGEGRVHVARMEREPALGVERTGTVPLGRVLHGGIEPTALLGQNMHEARPRLHLDTLEEHYKFVDIVAVDRAKIADAQVFEKAAGLHDHLCRLLRLQEQIAEA